MNKYIGENRLTYLWGKIKAFVSNAISGKVDKVSSSTDNAVVRFDGTSGDIQNSGVTINDSNHLTAAKLITSGGTSSQFVKGDGSLDSTSYAPLASPALTGTPSAPTAASGTNTTQIATTAFVQGEINDVFAEKDYSKQYLTLESLEDNNVITWKVTNTVPAKTISVSIDGGNTWVSKTSTTAGETLATLNRGEFLLVKGNDNPYRSNYFATTKKFNVSGNILSLVYGDNYINQSDLGGEDHAFYKLFSSCSQLISSSNLILPATELSVNCYALMFKDCTLMQDAPQLPATILKQYCYLSMFHNCTSLTEAPVLPATALVDYCYGSMFQGCTSLKEAPVLPATALVDYCYTNMFRDCSNLCFVKALFLSVPGSGYTGNWLRGVARKGVFIKNEDAPWDERSVSGAPVLWDFIAESEYEVARKFQLPKTASDVGALPDYEQTYFTTIDIEGQGISFYIPEIIGTGLIRSISYSTDKGKTWITTQNVNNQEIEIYVQSAGEGSKIYWKGDAGSLGFFDEDDWHAWRGACFKANGPFSVEGNVMSLCLGDDFAGYTIAYDGQFACLFYDYQNGDQIRLVDAKNLILPTDNHILPHGCFAYMFYQCGELVSAPKLSATILGVQSYYEMFNGCGQLEFIECLAEEISETDCTQYWVTDVAASGTFVIPDGMNDWTSGDDGIPSGWTVRTVSEMKHVTKGELDDVVGDIETLLASI